VSIKPAKSMVLFEALSHDAPIKSNLSVKKLFIGTMVMCLVTLKTP